MFSRRSATKITFLLRELLAIFSPQAIMLDSHGSLGYTATSLCVPAITRDNYGNDMGK